MKKGIKRSKIKISFIVFASLILILFLSQIKTSLSSSYEEEMNLKYNVKPSQQSGFSSGGGTKDQIILKPEKDLLKETLGAQENKNVFKEKETNIKKYDPAILEEFNTSEWIRVIVDLKDDSGVNITGTKKERRELLRQRDDWFKLKEDQVLAALSEEEIKNINKIVGAFSGEITKEGFNKLINDTKIKEITLAYMAPGYAILDQSVPLINANDVWNLGYTGSGIKVCVIDTGVNASHPDLNGKIADEYCYCSTRENPFNWCCPDHTDEDDDAEDNNGHGTHVTGIIASQDSTYRGVAYGADIYVVKVLNSSGSGDAVIWDNIADAIDWCRINKSVDIISISIGDRQNHPGSLACPITLTDIAINNAYYSGITVIIASGNEGYTTGINYPACSPKAISVGATTKSDSIASYTNRKSGVLDLLAPGDSIWSLRWNPNGNNPLCTGIGNTDIMVCSGTSMATPHVSGAAALLLQKQPSLTPDDIENTLEQTGTNIGGYPRIDVLSAMDNSCDKDHDGYDNGLCSGDDCNDNDASIHPGATEVCDDKDNDCDSIIDEGCTEQCTEPGYEQCSISSYGDCDASIAVNYYTNVNNIKWGAVNDAWDPYVIGEYKVGWKAVIASKMYYNVNNPNSDCYYGGCNGEEISSTSTKVTVTAPGTATTKNILGYDDTENYACWTWFNSFNPSYGADNPIYVLKCFSDSDCSSDKSCDKTSSWSNWDCINKKSNGQSCTSDSQCLSGYCDNDGVGLADDNWCFAPYNTYFDGQETSYCEFSTDYVNINCDERQVGEDLNLCLGLSYQEEECSNTCSNTDVINVFECNDAGCSCAEPLCDGLAIGNNIITCSANKTYFADKCTSTAGGEDRGDNICRSSAFASGCTADSLCNGIEAGTGGCNESCNIVCYSNSDCNDNNSTTFDKCNNPGTNNATCSNFVPQLCYQEFADVNICGNQAGYSSVYSDYLGKENMRDGNWETYACNSAPNQILKINSVYYLPNYATDYIWQYYVVQSQWVEQETGNITVPISCVHDNKLNLTIIGYNKNSTTNATINFTCDNTLLYQINSNRVNHGYCIFEEAMIWVFQQIPPCNNDSQCGTNGFVGRNPFCNGTNVFQEYITYTCNNPGTINSTCTYSISVQLNQNCGVNSCDGFGNNYCKNTSVYHNQTCYNRGCSSGACFSNSFLNETLVQTCPQNQTCSSGVCVNKTIICYNDSQCDDSNINTQDICNNPETIESYCSNILIIHFNNSLTSENLTFTGNQNITRYLSVPSGITNITNGYLNLSHIDYQFQDICNFGSGGNYGYGWNFYNPVGTHSIGQKFNTTFTCISNITISTNVPGETPMRLYSDINGILLGTSTSTSGTTTYNFPSCIALTNCSGGYCRGYWNISVTQPINFMAKFCMNNWAGGTDISATYDEVHVTYQPNSDWVQTLYNNSINYTMNNPSLSIDGINVWNYSGFFSQLNNKTNNLATYLNSYLVSCSYVNESCLIPFIFHSDTSGVLQYSDLIFSFTFTVINITCHNDSQCDDNNLSTFDQCINPGTPSSYCNYTSNISTITNITNCIELQAMNNNLTGNYTLDNNVNCSDTINWNDGEGFIPIGNYTDKFNGTFNGQGYNITNLFINRSESDYQGLFGVVQNSLIENVGLINVYVMGNNYVGGLIGYSHASLISHSFSTGNVYGMNKVGGLIGSCYDYHSVISTSYSTGNVTGNDYVGGLVGYSGGNSYITTSYSTGNVTGNDYVGGFVGYTYYTYIDNSYSIGNVIGNSDVGGFLGYNEFGSHISHSYSTGNVNGVNEVGGLVGYNTGACDDSYWNKYLSGQEISACGTVLTNEEMLLQSSYENWDFNNTWDIQQNSVPYLRFNPVPFFPNFPNFSIITHIKNCIDLQSMNNNLAGNYTLDNNIDCSDTINWNSGAGFIPIGNYTDHFNGTFNGQGYNITNLFINRNASYYVGLFSYVQNSEIKNVGLINVYVNGNNYVGGLIGHTKYSTIENCFSTGSVNGNSDVGGLIGGSFYGAGTINNSYSAANVNGYGEIGGLIGGIYNGVILNSYATGNVNGDTMVGGLIGNSYYEESITNSYATGNVNGIGRIGGLIGSVYYGGTITNSYATGSVNGSSAVGGLVGWIYWRNIFQSYATGSVNGNSDVGGLVGYTQYGIIQNSYSTGNVNGGSNVGGLMGTINQYTSIDKSYSTGSVITNSSGGGLVGYKAGGNCYNSYWNEYLSGQNTSACGNVLTNEEMLLQSSYVDWDFNNTWKFNTGYLPCLRFHCVLFNPLPTTISLKQNWNLISIPLTPYNDSIENIFGNIMNKVIVINGFEAGAGGGAKTYDPQLPEFSDLHNIDYKHGYWVKMNQSANLTINGIIPQNKTINLSTGWNLISCLCGTNKSVEEIFGSIMNKIIVINGFESGVGGGAKTYDPLLPEFSDLQELKPYYGYWVKMNESAVLDYNNVC